MREALRQAEIARAAEETPIGAVIVRDGRIIARGGNRRETRQDVTLHAEMIAIRKACARLGSWRLDGCELYVTLEPCAMCAGAIQQARIARVVYGAEDPKAGAVVSRLRYFDLPGLNHAVAHEGGLMSAECGAVLQEFFTWLRARDRQAGTKGVRRDRSKAQVHGRKKAPEGNPPAPQ
ncbi:MAG: nucleoside deaminase [Clostridia bacterium]|nr:nucleoside deaminase [Clostridia bacterium]